METKTTPKKWKAWHKVVLGIVIGFIALMVIAVNSDAPVKAEETTSTAATPAAPAKEEIKAAPTGVMVGQTLHTSYFDVKVTKVEVVKKVNTGNEYSDLKEEAGNSYLLLHIVLKNTDNESRMMFDGEVIINNEGKKYTYENAETVLADGFGVIMDNINPGVTKSTQLVYKIPADAKGDFYYHPARSGSDETIFLGNMK